MYKLENIKLILNNTFQKYYMKKLKNQFLKYFENSNDPEIIEMIKYINKNNKISMINNELTVDYNKIEIDILYDSKIDFHYVIDNDKKLYFKRLMTVEEIDNLYRALKLEQDKKSPHRYLSEEDVNELQNYSQSKNRKKLRIFELGAMEGMFSLSLVDCVDQLDIFECDSEWVEALTHTFAPYQHKVNIVNKYVSDLTSENTVCLDDYVNNEQIESFNIVKMDIEGSEVNALHGMKNFMERSYQLFMFICCYHRYNDEVAIRKICSKYEVYHNPGYFLFWNSDDYAPPFVRRCLLKVKKDKAIKKMWQ